MNESEHLLTCLAEEAGEVVQAVTKALRFGLKDGYPGTDRTNEQDIQDEFAQLLAVMEMLEDKVFGPRDFDRLQRTTNAKKYKVIEYMEYAVKTGALSL